MKDLSDINYNNIDLDIESFIIIERKIITQ